MLLSLLGAAVLLTLALLGGTGQLDGLLDPPSGEEGTGAGAGGGSGEDGATGDAGSGGGREVTGDPDLARRLLSELEVGEWASTRGYSRDRFPHWRRVDGCDVRQTVLIRDGEDVVVDDDCRVQSGTWLSPYDGRTFTDPGDLDIDHIVPLANAWRTGAAEWDDERRADFANDLERPQLIAVSATTNRAKGDQDPSQWAPPEHDYWCQYAQDWIAVKHYWQLWVTSSERDALENMLDTCG